MPEATHENITYSTEIDILHRVTDNSPSYAASHWHNSLEIVYILAGEEDVRVNNTPKRVMYPGDFVIVNPRDIHSYLNRNGSKSLLIQISYSYLKNFIPDIDSIKFICNAFPNQQEPRRQYQRIQESLYAISQLYPLPSSDSILHVHSLIFDILYRLRHYFSKEVSPEQLAASAKYMDRLGIIAAYIREHYQENLSITQVADLVSLNPDYFIRFFKKYMGMTFLEYLSSIRLEHIFIDLLETDLSIQELLETHGFTNYKLFMRLFRSKYGKTPNQMRTQVKNAGTLDP